MIVILMSEAQSKKNENGRTACRLVARMSDRVSVNSQVEHQHIIIG